MCDNQLGCCSVLRALLCHGMCCMFKDDYDEDFIWEPSTHKPLHLDAVQRCLGVLVSDQASPYWCGSLHIVAKLLQHMQDESSSVGIACVFHESLSS
jgi:hypothetical protein